MELYKYTDKDFLPGLTRTSYVGKVPAGLKYETPSSRNFVPLVQREGRVKKKAGLTRGLVTREPAMEGEWEEEEFERLYEEEMAMMREQAGIVLCFGPDCVQ